MSNEPSVWKGERLSCRVSRFTRWISQKMSSLPSETLILTQPQSSASLDATSSTGSHDNYNNNHRMSTSAASSTGSSKGSQVSSTSTTSSTTQLLETFENMLVYPSGHSVRKLSEQHRVLLITIKWLGCPICAHVVDQLQAYLANFLMLNIVPVICHQENLAYFSKHIAHTQLFHCKISTDIKRQLSVEKAGGKSYTIVTLYCNYIIVILL